MSGACDECEQATRAIAQRPWTKSTSSGIASLHVSSAIRTSSRGTVSRSTFSTCPRSTLTIRHGPGPANDIFGKRVASRSSVRLIHIMLVMVMLMVMM
eukprot:1699949-Karenia_brevis.AAC.1